MSYQTRKIRAKRERGRRLANIRWAKDRAMRKRLAELDPIKFTGQLVKRIIVIDHECIAREICFYDFDRYSDRKRKLNHAKALSFQ